MLKNNLFSSTFKPYPKRLQWLVFLLSLLFFWQYQTEKARAQVVPDATLPNNSVVNTTDNLIEITGGTTAGNNLFHSFTTFSVPTNFQASFLNNPAIQNIITRVTGGSLSEIDGLIRANGAANLILINPNGIIFGSNASLNLGGSFLGTTANSVRFGDGIEFSASNPQATPILSLNVPIGLQFGNNNGEIAVLGSGNNLIYDFTTFTIAKDFRNLGLQVRDGQTLALVGGNISLVGGNLTAVGGNIELGAVGDGLVQITPLANGWTLNYAGISTFQDVRLIEAASVDASGNNGGRIGIQGRNLLVSDASAILADTLGNGTGGNIQLKTTESIEAVGFSLNPEIPFITYISTDVAPNATGNGGSIDIATNNLFVGFGGQISTGTFGSGNAGTISVNAPEITLTSGSPITGGSGLYTAVAFEVTGNGGQINLDTQNLVVSDGAQIAAFSFGFGNAGDINIQTNNLEVVGTSPSGTPSFITANGEFETANGGDINIEAGNLLVGFGGQIITYTGGSGNAGTITVNAPEITITSGAQGSGSSGLFAIGTNNSTGNSGRINLNTQNLVISEGAQINVTSTGLGDAGIISIRGKKIDLIGTSPISIPSVISANNLVGKGGRIEIFGEELIISGGSIQTITDGSNNAGDIAIQVEKLFLSEGGQILNNTRGGSGNAGNIDIDAETIELIGRNRPTDSPIFIPQTSIGSSVLNFSSGSGGNITIDTNNLILKDGAQIAVSTDSPGDGGTLTIDATESVLLSGTSNFNRTGLFATAIVDAGDGGEIVVNTDRLTVKDGAIISTSNFFSLDDPTVLFGRGTAGNLLLNANSIELDNGGIISANVASGGEGSIFIDTDRLLLSGESQINTNAIETATGGNISIKAETIVALDNSDITANAQNNFAGQISIDSKAIFGTKFSEILTSESDITAFSALGVSFSGTVTINTPDVDPAQGSIELSGDTIDASRKIVAGCSATQNNFTVGGGKGLPESPYFIVVSQSTWRDLREANNLDSQLQTDNSDFVPNKIDRSIVEASAIEKNNDGTLSLTATSQTSQIQTLIPDPYCSSDRPNPKTSIE
jgi:filamentous hemagglutinin family protein